MKLLLGDCLELMKAIPSGSGVACVNTNRKFIGIEQDDKYFEIAKNRINSQHCLDDCDAYHQA